MRWYVPLLMMLMILIGASAVMARKWTDTTGRTMEGKFVRVFQGNVVILRGQRVSSIPFADLSDDDQAFVRQELEKLGQANLVPSVDEMQRRKEAAETEAKAKEAAEAQAKPAPGAAPAWMPEVGTRPGRRPAFRPPSPNPNPTPDPRSTPAAEPATPPGNRGDEPPTQPGMTQPGMTQPGMTQPGMTRPGAFPANPAPATPPPPQYPTRVWTTRDGVARFARLKSVDSNGVLLEESSGMQASIGLRTLSLADFAYLRSTFPNEAEADRVLGSSKCIRCQRAMPSEPSSTCPDCSRQATMHQRLAESPPPGIAPKVTSSSQWQPPASSSSSTSSDSGFQWTGRSGRGVIRLVLWIVLGLGGAVVGVGAKMFGRK